MTLADEEARQLRTVLRARPGDRVVLFDGTGREADAEVAAVARNAVSCRTLGPVRTVPEPVPRVELACALPRAGAADDVVRVAVEMGARAIRPLIAERGVWRPDEVGESGLPARFQRAASAALKQSGLSWLPEILPPTPVGSLVFEPQTCALLGSAAPGAAPVAAALGARRPIARATVVVGPEGGLTPAEEASLVAKGAVPVRCGPGTLRVETAVVALLAHLMGG